MFHHLAKIVPQRLQVVVFRIDRPDGFVKRRHQFAGHPGNLAKVGARIVGKGGVFLGHGAQEGNLGDTRTQIIVNIVRDPQPLLFQRPLLFKADHLTPHPVPDEITADADDHRRDGDHGDAPKPGCFPKGLGDEHTRRRLHAGQPAHHVRAAHPESVLTRGQFVISGLMKIARSHAVHLVPFHHQTVARRHRRRRLQNIVAFAMTGRVLVQNRERPGLRILSEFHDLGHAVHHAVTHPSGRRIVDCAVVLDVLKRRLKQDRIAQFARRF